MQQVIIWGDINWNVILLKEEKNYFTVFRKNIWQSAAICTNIWNQAIQICIIHLILWRYLKIRLFTMFSKGAALCILSTVSIWKTGTCNSLAFSSPQHLVISGSSYIPSIWLLEAAFWEIRVRGDKSYSKDDSKNVKSLENMYTEV